MQRWEYLLRVLRSEKVALSLPHDRPHRLAALVPADTTHSYDLRCPLAVRRTCNRGCRSIGRVRLADLRIERKTPVDAARRDYRLSAGARLGRG
jgi:hypothetical protein